MDQAGGGQEQTGVVGGDGGLPLQRRLQLREVVEEGGMDDLGAEMRKLCNGEGGMNGTGLDFEKFC